jgi:hypothetical protein|tara:strand:+ start:262 stop:393 length:132 start_codon:yes stop_codon:yes gene_type:complete
MAVFSHSQIDILGLLSGFLWLKNKGLYIYIYLCDTIEELLFFI